VARTHGSHRWRERRGRWADKGTRDARRRGRRSLRNSPRNGVDGVAGAQHPVSARVDVGGRDGERVALVEDLAGLKGSLGRGDVAQRSVQLVRARELLNYPRPVLLGMRRRRRLSAAVRAALPPLGLVVVTMAATLLWPSAAAAHGPCHCATAATTLPKPGEFVSFRSGAYAVVFNPRRRDLIAPVPARGGGGPPAVLAAAHRPDAPTRTYRLGTPLRPERRARFRVPPTTPGGLYVVAIFDGSEGGTHGTWDYLLVDGPPPVRASAPPPRPLGPTGLVAAGVALVAAAAVGGHRLGRRRGPR
jgi:hypothetical protein